MNTALWFDIYTHLLMASFPAATLGHWRTRAHRFGHIVIFETCGRCTARFRLRRVRFIQRTVTSSTRGSR